MAQIKPLQDRVLVQRCKSEERTASGIIIPDSAKEKPMEGIIISTGPGKYLDNGNRVELTVKAGDRVLFTKYAGTEVKLADEEFLIMREDDILGILG